MMELYRRFFVVDGCDGSGKSSLSKGVAAVLRQRGYSVVLSREPGGTQVGELIRQVLCDPSSKQPQLSAESELALFCAARSQHLQQVILPALDEAQVVICDRYTDSTRIYQGLLKDLCAEDVEYFIKVTSHGLKPRLTFLLDGDESVFRQRVFDTARSDQLSRYDQLSLADYRKIRLGFRHLATQNSARYHILHSDQYALSELIDEAVAVVVKLLDSPAAVDIQ